MIIQCAWDDTPDRRLTVSKADYEHRGVVISNQRRQIAALQERLRLNQLPDDLPNELDEYDDGPNGTNQSDAEDDLVTGFDKLRLDEDNVYYYGVCSPFADLEPPVNPKPRLPSIEGYQHSTSRMYKIQPMHLLGPGPGRESQQWDIYLPRNEDGSQLITRGQHDEVLNDFFRFFTAWTLRLVPHFFLRDLVLLTESPDPKPPINHYSPMLHNVVLAVALSFSSIPALRERAVRDRFLEKGKLTLDTECQRPTLSTVQSLDFISSYYSGVGDQTLGFMYFGSHDSLFPTAALSNVHTY